MQNMEFLSLSYYNQRKKAMLQMENWVVSLSLLSSCCLSLPSSFPTSSSFSGATRLNCRIEHGPWHLPISHKMHTQPCLSIRNLNYSQAWAQVMRNGNTDGAYLNWRSPSRLMPECQGSALPPVSIGAPLEKRKLNLLIELVLFASMKTAIAPIERVQLLMQSQNAMIQSGRLSRPYKGIFNCFARTIYNEGVISLWRGNTARVIGGCSMRVIVFSSYARSQNGHWDYGRVLLAVGLFAASPLVAYPLIYAGTRLANDIKTTSKVGKWQFNGMVDVCRKTLKSDGIAGLYRGFPVALVENIMTHIARNRLSTALKPGQLPRSLGLQNNHLAAVVVAIGLDVCTMMALYPMDTVSKRMMMTSGEAIKYKNTSDAFSQTFKNEGLKSFYNGGRAKMLQIAAARGFYLFLFYLIGGGPIMGKKNGSGDSDEPTFNFTIRWMKGNGEQF